MRDLDYYVIETDVPPKHSNDSRRYRLYNFYICGVSGVVLVGLFTISMGEYEGNLNSIPYFAIYFGNKKYNTIWKMPSVLLSDYYSQDLSGPEPWSDEIIMFTPHQDRQILLYESAHCRAVETFFKMAGIEYLVEQRSNAEFMSPNGRVPLVASGSFIFSDFERVTSHFKEKGRGIGVHLEDEKERADMRSYLSTVKPLHLAELYLCWQDEHTYQTVTKSRYGSVYPFPLNHILPWKKRREVLEELSVLKWKKKTIDDVYKDVDKCLRTFSDQLSENKWFFGAKPTEVDALLFGHLFAILTTQLPDTRLRDTVNNYPNLVEFYDRVQHDYYENLPK